MAETKKGKTFENLKTKLIRSISHKKDETVKILEKEVHEIKEEEKGDGLEGEGGIKDYELLQTLGTGSFGRVHLARNVHDGIYSAIKILPKEQILKRNQISHTINERNILKKIDHPFIIKLITSFKDNANLYIVLEFCAGGEIFRLLRQCRRFGELASRFYSSQIVLSLKYLHSMNIIYRDLKPENIMVGRDGYIKIADFGFTKEIEGATYTLCGTPDYLAPEMILSKGYGRSVDWWAFGVFVFEIVAGYTPFYGNTPLQTYEKIVGGKVVPPKFFSADLSNLVMNLLKVDVTSRLGNLKAGADDIIKHAWFVNIDWEAILDKKVKAPFVPTLNSDHDCALFDRYEEEKLKVAKTDLYRDEFVDF